MFRQIEWENKIKLSRGTDICHYFIFVEILFHCKHGTIIRTGIICKKIPCYMRDSVCRWFIVENAKIFRSYVKHF